MHSHVEKVADKFDLRCNNSQMDSKNFLKGQAYMQQHLFELISNEDYCSFLADVTITVIDKTDHTGPKQWGTLFEAHT